MLDLFLDVNNSIHKRISILSKKLFEAYSDYLPTIVGTYPINIAVESSDIDVVMTTVDMGVMCDKLNHSFSDKVGFELKISDVIVCRFEHEGFDFELYVSNKPVESLNSYRHLVIEERFLRLLGESFRQEIISLKEKGLKTEPAFALVLGLFGNPYDKLLSLESLTDDVISQYEWSNELKQISSYDDLKLTYFSKGWSFDLKFIANDFESLIRVSPLSENRAHVIDKTALLSQSINCIKPLEYHSSKYNIEVYEWLEGEDLDKTLGLLPKQKQYHLGLEAGCYLNSIHAIKGESFDWHDHYLKKIKRVISNYKSCGIKMPDDALIIHYLENNHSVLQNRPITFQHGDYHLGNMLLSPSNTLGLIDFNRSSEGDPWEEYDRIAFSYRISPYFAIGQLHGYFKDIPDNFFDVVAVYSALNCLAGIPWAMMYGDDDVAVMKDNYMSIKTHYNDFKTVIPKWYSDNLEEVLSWNLKV